ncbi:MAG: HAD hydrolase-like protein [Atopobiaceae bacterium]|nr:HAD hydrolase-like protein [Atopobiaceae bacterium]
MITRYGMDVSNRRCVVLDFDGTLADTKPGIVRTATKVLLEWGIPEDVVSAHVGGLIGPPFPQAFSMVFGVSPDDAATITQRYREIYFQLGVEAWPFFPGVTEALRHLREAGKKTCVASSKLHTLILRGVADNDATELFDALVGCQEGVADTKEQAIRSAIEAAGCKLDEAVMVGDRFHDVEGAAAVGIPCVGVLFGDTGTREELAGAGAVAVVDTVQELETVLLDRG